MRLFSRKREQSPVALISVDQLKRRLDQGDNVLVVDVRQPNAYAAYPGEIPNSVRIPPSELPERYGELPRDRPIVLYCT